METNTEINHPIIPRKKTMTIADETHKYAPVAAVPVDGGDVDYGLDKAITSSTSTEAQPYLEVVAPATLPEVGIGRH